MPQPSQTNRPSLAFFIFSVSATLCLAGGFIGLFAPDILPVLAKPLLAYGLLAAGGLLEILSVVELVSGIRAQNRQQ